MSELKVYSQCYDGTDGLFYLKSEADKVIANRDYEIKSLKDSIGKLLKAKTEQIITEVMQKALIYGEGFVRVEDMMTLIIELRRQKYKRCLLYAKNHKNLGDLATDAARLIGLNAYAFTKETETACIAYWNRIRDCHYRRYNEWLELAEKYKEAK